MAGVSSKFFTVVLEGNIASGKSTLLRSLDAEIHRRQLSDMVRTFPEPIKVWQQFGTQNHNLLQLMYQDPVRYAYPFQNLAAFSKAYQLSFTTPINIVERSLDAQTKVFIPLLEEEGKLKPLERELLYYSIDFLKQTPNLQVDLYIYLRRDPEKNYEWVQSRNRHEETGVTEAYLRKIHLLYDSWLLDPDLSFPVWVRDPSQTSATELLTEILSFQKNM